MELQPLTLIYLNSNSNLNLTNKFIHLTSKVI